MLDLFDERSQWLTPMAHSCRLVPSGHLISKQSHSTGVFFASIIFLAPLASHDAASSFDRLSGDADGLLGSGFLDGAEPTLSAVSLHRLVVTSGVVDISQAKSTYGHWRTKMQCKSDPTLHY
jgi:hypothetical protein